MRRLLTALGGLTAAVMAAVAGVVVVELALAALEGGDAGPRATADALSDQPEAEAMLAEIYSGRIRTRFHPYVHYRLAPFAGAHVEIGEDGRRVVPGTATSTRAPTVWMFGGSTLWGMGARDAHTIPAELARALGPAVRVESFGQVGYTSTQGMLTLLEALQAGRRPDVVVFYDGVNEVLPALKLGRIGVPLDVPRRELEFNLTRPDELGRLLSAAAQGVARRSEIVGRLLGPEPARPAASIEDPKAWAARIVAAYAANVEAVAGLGRAYGFDVLFFWQPTVFTKAEPSKDEAAAAKARASFAPLYAATRARVRAELGARVVDLSEAFGGDPSPVFFDFCHVNELGNRRLAASMLPRVKEALHDLEP